MNNTQSSTVSSSLNYEQPNAALQRPGDNCITRKSQVVAYNFAYTSISQDARIPLR